ncbi:MAG: AI-2E family transporter [Burkholderiales bacterium]|nr:AI-2E family transporter [Burkholderiales bacterium]
MLAITALALAWILLPFGGAIMWAAIIALLFQPVHVKLTARLGGRPTPAALVTLVLVCVIVILPFVLLTMSLAREAMGLYQRLQSGDLNPALYLRGVFVALPQWVLDLLRRFGMANFDSLQRQLTAAMAQGSQFIAGRAFGLGQDTFGLGVNLFVMLYLSFFLVRDGDRLSRAALRGLPLSPAHKADLLWRFTTVIRATVKGNLTVAATQGALGGLALWWLDVSAPILWGAVMAFLSLLPAIGAALVWAPVAIYFIASGSILQGVLLIAYGVMVIGLVDNLLRPILVGKDTGMPDYLVMTTTLGGMVVFGLNGFVIGPAIAAMFIAVWQLALPHPASVVTPDKGATPDAGPVDPSQR